MDWNLLAKKILNKIRKGTNINRFHDKIKIATALNLILTFTVMHGFPDDSKDTGRDVLRFMKKTPSEVVFHIASVVPMKGTPLYDEYIKEGLLKDLYLKDYVNATMVPFASTKHMSKQEVFEFVEKFTRAVVWRKFKSGQMNLNGFNILRFAQRLLKSRGSFSKTSSTGR